MRKSYRNTAFLVELLINVLVFSISCAILVGVFGKASQLARHTREENYAAAEIHALFELARARGVDEITAGAGDGVVKYYYDKNWNPVEEQDVIYLLTFEIDGEDTGAGTLNRLRATARSNEGREICAMETALYSPAEGGAPLG